MKIIDLMANPDKFFQDVGAKPYNYYVPLIAILLNTMASMLATLHKENLLAGIVVTVVVIAISIMVLLILMLLYATVMYALLYIIKLKKLSLKKIIEIVAYGFIISAFGNIILEILYYLGNSTLPRWLDNLINLIFVVWMCLIWAKGIQHTYNLKFNKSLIPAVIVGAIELFVVVVLN
jgi:hypothetical protein